MARCDVTALPVRVLGHIWSFLPLRRFRAMRAVSKAFHDSAYHWSSACTCGRCVKPSERALQAFGTRIRDVVLQYTKRTTVAEMLEGLDFVAKMNGLRVLSRRGARTPSSQTTDCLGTVHVHLQPIKKRKGWRSRLEKREREIGSEQDRTSSEPLSEEEEEEAADAVCKAGPVLELEVEPRPRPRPRPRPPPELEEEEEEEAALFGVLRSMTELPSVLASVLLPSSSEATGDDCCS